MADVAHLTSDREAELATQGVVFAEEPTANPSAVPLKMLPEFVMGGALPWTPAGVRADRVASQFIGVGNNENDDNYAPFTGRVKLTFSWVFWAASWFFFIAGTVCFEKQPKDGGLCGNDETRATLYVAGFGVSYAVYFVLCMRHKELWALMTPRRNGVLQIVNMVCRPPRLTFWIECYHMESEVSVTVNTDDTVSTSYDETKVVTHQATEEFLFNDWYDASEIHLPALEVARQGLVRLHTSTELKYAEDEVTRPLVESAFEAFVSRNKSDEFQKSDIRLDVGECPVNATYGERGWCITNATWYMLAIVLGFGPLYRMLVVSRTATAVTKIIKVVRADGNPNKAHAKTNIDEVDDDAPMSQSSMVRLSQHRAFFVIIGSAICIALVGAAMGTNIATIDFPGPLMLRGNIGVFNPTIMCGLPNSMFTKGILNDCHKSTYLACCAFTCIALVFLLISFGLGVRSETAKLPGACRFAFFALSYAILALTIAFATALSMLTSDGCELPCFFAVVGSKTTSLMDIGGVLGPAPYLLAAAWVVALAANTLGACVFHPDPDRAVWCWEGGREEHQAPASRIPSGATADAGEYAKLV